MNPEARKYLADIGRKGGQKSRRKLTKAQARAMVRARTAKRAALRQNDPSSATVVRGVLLCVHVFACPTCGSRAWHSDWGAILWAQCESCETRWKHTRRADEATAVITRQEIGLNESLTGAML